MKVYWEVLTNHHPYIKSLSFSSMMLIIIRGLNDQNMVSITQVHVLTPPEWTQLTPSVKLKCYVQTTFQMRSTVWWSSTSHKSGKKVTAVLWSTTTNNITRVFKKKCITCYSRQIKESISDRQTDRHRSDPCMSAYLWRQNKYRGMKIT